MQQRRQLPEKRPRQIRVIATCVFTSTVVCACGSSPIDADSAGTFAYTLRGPGNLGASDEIRPWFGDFGNHMNSRVPSDEGYIFVSLGDGKAPGKFQTTNPLVQTVSLVYNSNQEPVPGETTIEAIPPAAIPPYLTEVRASVCAEYFEADNGFVCQLVLVLRSVGGGSISVNAAPCDGSYDGPIEGDLRDVELVVESEEFEFFGAREPSGLVGQYATLSGSFSVAKKRSGAHGAFNVRCR